MDKSTYDLHGYERPLGYQQVTPTGTAAALTLPSVPPGLYIRYAKIQNNTAGTVRWRDDNKAPTASTGMVIQANGSLDYYGEMTQIQFILASGSPILDISYYA